MLIKEKRYELWWRDEEMPPFVVISSNGKVAQQRGDALGQFERDKNKGYYVQSNSDKEDEETRYLYPDKNDEWWVNKTPGESTCYLKNPTLSKTLPVSGWQYRSVNMRAGHYRDDPGLTITSGPLSLCSQYTVTDTGDAAEKMSSNLGVFTRTERWWRGMPVYANTQARLLYHSSYGKGWVIRPKLDKYGLEGSRSHNSPATETSWRYWTGNKWSPASVTVTGSD